MRGHWGRIAGSRRAYRKSFCLETLEDRLALSHAPLALEAPEQPMAFAAEMAPSEIGPVAGEHISAVVASLPPVTLIDSAPDRPALALPPSGDRVVTGTEVASGSMPIVAPPARVEGRAAVPMESVDRSLIVFPFPAGELFQRSRAEDSGSLEFRGEFALRLVKFRPDFVETRAVELFGHLRQQWITAVETEPASATAGVPIFATGTADAGIYTSALPNTASSRPAYASTGSTALALRADTENDVLIIPVPPSRFAAGEVSEPETLDASPTRGDRGNTAVEAARALSVEIVVSTAVTSAKAFMSELYDVQVGFAPTVVLDTVLLSTVALNGAALEQALDDVMREVDDLGIELVSWIDDLRSSPWTVTVVAVAVTGAGGLMARRLRDSRPDVEIAMVDSSSWLFARLQDPSDL